MKQINGRIVSVLRFFGILIVDGQAPVLFLTEMKHLIRSEAGIASFNPTQDKP
jgi:hypothetical protein